MLKNTQKSEDGTFASKSQERHDVEMADQAKKDANGQQPGGSAGN